METRRGQKPSLSLVVMRVSRCVLFPSAVYIESSVWKIHSCHDIVLPVAVVVFPYIVRMRLFSYASECDTVRVR